MPELNTQGLQGERSNQSQAVPQPQEQYNQNQFHNSTQMYFQSDQQQQYYPQQRGDYYPPRGRARGYKDQPHRGRGRANKRGGYVNYQGNRGAAAINNIQMNNENMNQQQQQPNTQRIQNNDDQNYWDQHSEYSTYGQYDRQSYDNGSSHYHEDNGYFREEYDNRSQYSYNTQNSMHYSDRGSVNMHQRGNHHRGGRGRGERGHRGSQVMDQSGHYKAPIARTNSNADPIVQMNQPNLIQQHNQHYYRHQERGIIQPQNTTGGENKNNSSQGGKPKYTIHRRQYGSNNNNNNNGPNNYSGPPVQNVDQIPQKSQYKRLKEEHKMYQENDNQNPSQKHKIVHRSGGRGRGQNLQQNQGHGRGMRQTQDEYENPNYNYSEQIQSTNNSFVNYKQGPGDHENSFARFDDNEIFDHDEKLNLHVSEYQKYDEYGDEDGYQQMQKREKNTPNIKYQVKTFDDDIDSDISFDDNNSNPDRNNNRRGPKLIKFKQKKPSERLALSQIKSEQSQLNSNYDVFIPKNQQKIQQIQILKPYKGGFEQPKFYQGPSWKFVRQSTNQNSKQKHYENGDYDNVQFNFPGAEVDDKETDGEMKLYPPIDDYSDEDVGINPSLNVHRAKISFNKSKAQIEKEKLKNQTAVVSIMPSAFEVTQKVEKKKCPPVIQAKTFTFDQKKTEQIFNMESAENFFIKEPEELNTEKVDKKSFFEKYVTEKVVIDEKINQGKYFKGVIRMNPKFRYRAYVSIQELNIDILVEGYKLMNRAMDGDNVLIEMMPVHQWIEMTDQNTLSAKITTLCQTTGEVQYGISHLTKAGADNQAYTNEAAIENRAVDSQDKLSQSCSQSEDDQKINILNKLKPKKFTVISDQEGEGYFASSENNIENRKDLKKKSSLRKESQEYLPPSEQKDQLTESNNSTDQELELNVPKRNSIKLKENDDKDLWENLEEELHPDSVRFDKNQIQNKINESQKGMSIAQFLGQDKESESEKGSKAKPEKLSSFLRKELKGNRSEIIDQINNYGKTIRPLAKVVGLIESPSRIEEQMVTLIEIEKDTSHQKLPVDSKPQTIVFAVPVNDKLPWFITSATPEEFEADKKKERNPRHRYYVAKFEDWRISQRRPHCNVIESIGEAGNLKAESMRILKMHSICTDNYENEKDEPTSNVHECLKPFASNIDPATNEWIIPESEIKKRLDLRKKRIFTIDPITAKDLDDALSIEKITGTIYEIGVHIADVSYFVQQGSDLDKEALKRSTSTYFVHKVFPMLPRLLCERLCSLNPNVDRLTYSIFYRLDLATGEIDTSFVPKIERSIINSCAKWNYELAQNIIDGKIESEEQITEKFRPSGGHKFLDCAQDILTMNKAAQARRKKRFEAGSIEFVNREFNFTLNNESMYPISWKESPKMQSKQLVEEYMLLANILVAEFIAETCKDKALLRVHNDLKDGAKEQLGSFFKKLGLNIDVSDALSLSKSLTQLRIEQKSDDKMNVVNRKFLTNLQQAKYITIDKNDQEDLIHYGLNFNLYTHFTSPIRRYADLLVHRLLTISLKEKENTRDKLDGLDYSEYAEEISEKSFNARKASKDCQTLFHCLLLKEHGQRVYDSLVFNIESHQIGIYINELNMHFNIRLRDDNRIDQTTFFENDLSIVMSFRNPQALAPGLQGYSGIEQLKISNTQRKKEQEMKRIADDRQDLVRRLMTQNDTKEVNQEIIDQALKDQSVDDNLKTNCILHVFDHLKVKIWASDSFPMEIRCQLLINESDMLEYNDILDKQTIKLEQLRKFAEIENSKTGYMNDFQNTEAF